MLLELAHGDLGLSRPRSFHSDDVQGGDWWGQLKGVGRTFIRICSKRERRSKTDRINEEVRTGTLIGYAEAEATQALLRTRCLRVEGSAVTHVVTVHHQNGVRRDDFTANTVDYFTGIRSRIPHLNVGTG